jgi:hypothetical protein
VLRWKGFLTRLIPKYLGFLMATHPPKLEFFFKGFPEDARLEPHTVPESLEIARGTLYETWYRCIKASPYMAEIHSTGVWRSYAQMVTYELFGDLRDTTFDSWWLNRGYEIFREQEGFKKIIIQGQDSANAGEKKIIIEVPLTVSPGLLKVQFEELLIAMHPEYVNFNRWLHSTAKIPFESSRLTSVSLNLYMTVFENWLLNKVPLYEIGESLKLSKKYTVRRTDTPADIREKHLQMSLIVTEYLTKAKRLVAHASEGQFPCVNEHEWVKKRVRSSKSK